MIPPPISVNRNAWRAFEALCADAAELRIGCTEGSLGERLVDAGAKHPGGLEAGRRIAEICMGGLGQVRFAADATLPRWPFGLVVSSSQPVLACLGSQYAGWSLTYGEKPAQFAALGSGPARALARREKLFEELGYADAADAGVLVLESNHPPPEGLVAKVAQDCRLPASRLGIIYAPTQSLAGAVQVVARVLEVALHKAHELRFPLAHILDGVAAAPLPPPHPDFIIAMGRTNDAVIFGGRVHLFVSGPEEQARALAEGLPSSTSRDYGKPFAEIFRAVNGDFYAIDPALFSPAEVRVTALATGRTFHAGRLDPDALDASFA
jgi:methenyltetrahydromethanopterin cyclohydrolase